MSAELPYSEPTGENPKVFLIWMNFSELTLHLQELTNNCPSNASTTSVMIIFYRFLGRVTRKFRVLLLSLMSRTSILLIELECG